MVNHMLHINSNDTNTSGTGTDFTVYYNNPMRLQEGHEYRLSLNNFSIFNSWFNISSAHKNNEIRLSADNQASWDTYTIPDGHQTVSSINAFIVSILGVDKVYFTVDEVYNKLLLNIAAGYAIDFNLSTTLNDMLGFDSLIYDNSESPYLASSMANLTPIRNILVHCSLVDNHKSYVNGMRSDLLYVSPLPSVAPNSLVQLVSGDRHFVKCNTTYITQVRIYLTDQYGKALYIPANDQASCCLLIEDVND